MFVERLVAPRRRQFGQRGELREDVESRGELRLFFAAEHEKVFAFARERGVAELGLGRRLRGKDGVVERHGFAFLAELGLHDRLLLPGVELERPVALHHFVEELERAIDRAGIDRLHRRLSGEKKRGLGEAARRRLLRERGELCLRSREISAVKKNLSELHPHFREQWRFRMFANESKRALDHFVGVRRRLRFREKHLEILRVLRRSRLRGGRIRDAKIFGGVVRLPRLKSQLGEREAGLGLPHGEREVIEKHLQRLLRARVAVARLGEPFLDDEIGPQRALRSGRGERPIFDQKAIVVLLLESRERGIEGRAFTQLRRVRCGALKLIGCEQKLALLEEDEPAAQLDLAAL